MVRPADLQQFNQATAQVLGRANTSAAPVPTAAAPSVLPQAGTLQASPEGFSSNAISQLQTPDMGYCAKGHNNGQQDRGYQTGGSSFDQSSNPMSSMMSLMSSMLRMMMMLFNQGGGSASPYQGAPAAISPDKGNVYNPYQPATGVSTPIYNQVPTTPTTLPNATTPSTTTPNTTPPTTTSKDSAPAPADIDVTMVESYDSVHNGEVKGVLQSLVAADDIKSVTKKTDSMVNTPKNEAEFKNLLTSTYTEPLKIATDSLNDIVKANSATDRVVNMSFGATGLNVMDFSKEALVANPNLLKSIGLSKEEYDKAQKNVAAPTSAADKANLNQYYASKNSYLNSVDVNKKLVNYVTTTLGGDAGVKKAMDNYRTATQQASAKNIVVTVASGNDQHLYQSLKNQGINVDPTWAMNNLAFSNDVISVGAIDNKGTANTADDVAPAFASTGNAQLRPTVAANGVNVNGKDELDGTSFSSPQVAATVQKMLEANSKLTFDQVKKILTSTSTYSVAGQPVVDMAKAIAAAQAA